MSASISRLIISLACIPQSYAQFSCIKLNVFPYIEVEFSFWPCMLLPVA